MTKETAENSTARAEAPRVAVIHALAASMAPAAAAFAEIWPEARVMNLLDDSLSDDLASDGLSPGIAVRMLELTSYCEDNGARAILFSCSAFNSCIDRCKAAAKVTVLKPEEAMVDEGLALGSRLAVLATFHPTVASLSEQIQARAETLGQAIELDARYVPEALDALHAGDPERHDRLIAAATAELPEVDAVLLAQFSMARAADAARARSSAPVLTSPASAVARLRAVCSAAS